MSCKQWQCALNELIKNLTVSRQVLPFDSQPKRQKEKKNAFSRHTESVGKYE